MHMKNVQIRYRTCHVHGFEDIVVLDSELEKHENKINVINYNAVLNDSIIVLA
jgi:hypothetical protein